MGVKDLWTVLSPVGEVLPLSALEGKTIAVDLSCWVCEAQAIRMGYIAKPHLRNLLFRTSTFLQLGILPVFVIEGAAPQLKWDTISARNQKVWQGRKVATSSKTGKRSNFKSILKECKELLDLLGVPWVQAEGEAEATCAALNYEKIVDGVVTQDNDVFLYGGQVVYRNLSANQNKATVDRFDMKQIKEKLHLHRDSMVVMAILLGCDYLPAGIPGVGKEKALQLLRSWQQCDAIARLFSWTKEAKAEESSTLHPQNGKEKYTVGVESQIRQKAVAVPGFPFPQIVTEYTQQRRVGLKDCNWKCPQMLKLVEWCVRKLDWVEDYAFEKIVPLVARWQVNNIILPTLANKSAKQLQLQPLQIKKKCVNKGTASFVVEWKVCPDLVPFVPSSSHTFTTKEPNFKVQSALSNLLQEFEALHLKQKGKSKAKTKKGSSEGKPTVKTSYTKKDSSKIDRYLSVNSAHSDPILKTSLSSRKSPPEECKLGDTSQMQENLSLNDTDDADISLIVDQILGIDIGNCKVQECGKRQNSVRSFSQRVSSGSRYCSQSQSRNKEDKENIGYEPSMNTVGKFDKLGIVDSLIYLSSDDESERKPLSLKDVNRLNTLGLKAKTKHSEKTVSSRDIKHPTFTFDKENMGKIGRVCNVEQNKKSSDIKHKSRVQSKFEKEATTFRKALWERMQDTKLCSDSDSHADITDVCYRNDIDSLVTSTATCIRNEGENMATTNAMSGTKFRIKTISEIKIDKDSIYQSSEKEVAASNTNSQVEIGLEDREEHQFNPFCSFKQNVIQNTEKNLQDVQDNLSSTLENTTLPPLDDMSCMRELTPSSPQRDLYYEKSSTSLPPERDISRKASDGMITLQGYDCKRERTALPSQSIESTECSQLQVSKDLFDDSDIGEMSKNMSLFNLCTSFGLEHTPVQEPAAAPIQKHVQEFDTCPLGSSENGSLASLKNFAGSRSSYKFEVKCVSPSRPMSYSPLVRYECCYPNPEGNVVSTPEVGRKTNMPNFNLLGGWSSLHGHDGVQPESPQTGDVGESVISENQDPHVSYMKRRIRLNDTFSPIEVTQTLAERLKSRFCDKSFSKLIDKLQ